ncbi:AT-hook motif nuclear-localized protein 1-like [Silene latifolia]|uniref:AT-hook motif nuclear-localized protein 1-like n=1 Tax=Silene latifolia TaxID=37657 RepID=UPI003D770676
MMIVPAGEDIAMKIASFSEQEMPGICVLSATGSISKVTIRQPGCSGVTATHEGRFDIISLSGSFITFNDGVPGTRTGGVSVFLVGPDGRVLGGILAGLLIAATPVQVLLGSFNFDRDHQEGNDNEGEFDEDVGEDKDDVPSKLEPKMDENKDKDAGNSKLEPKLLEPTMDVDEDEGEDSVTSKLAPNPEPKLLEPEMDMDEDEGEDSVTSKLDLKLQFFG